MTLIMVGISNTKWQLISATTGANAAAINTTGIVFQAS
jgi:hypothetical protein